MKTYNTIQEAFGKGAGDVFFKKDNHFIALSRKEESTYDGTMEAQGFTLMEYSEVISMANKKNDIDSAALWCVAVKRRSEDRDKVLAEAHQKKMINTGGNFGNGYYDEFPDAYGQSL